MKAPELIDALHSAGVPMAGRDLTMQRHAILAYVRRQPRPLQACVSMCANEYSMQGYAPGDCEWRACVDVVAWQSSNCATKI